MRTTAFVTGRDLERLPLVGGEADLAAASVMVRDAGELEALTAAGGPGRDGGALRVSKEGESALTGLRIEVATAIVWIVDLVVHLGCVRIVGAAKRWWGGQVHVSRCRQGKQRDREREVKHRRLCC